MEKIVLVIGTRPEAVKMAPVYFALAQRGRLEPVLVSTGQHAQLLKDVLEPLDLVPQYRLDVMSPSQTPNDVIARVIAGVASILELVQPKVVLVQGDTSTAFAAALAAYHLRLPVGHVEAGLRTYDHNHPFPEEGNRQLIDRLASLCFAATPGARDNLLSERIPENRIQVTGNTVVDALELARSRATYRCEPDTLLITLHRRESFGEPLQAILQGVSDFLKEVHTARAVWPIHPNPEVARALNSISGLTQRINVVHPLNYVDFAGALSTCRLVLTDSGGIQEEAPSFGKRVLVARETTERPEGVASGHNSLIGRTREGVVRALTAAWSEPPYEGPLPAPNPFGDGRAGMRIALALEGQLVR